MSDISTIQIGVLGCGGLGASLVRGLTMAGADVRAFDRNLDKVTAALGEGGAEPASSIEEIAAGSDVILVAVKPYATVAAIEDIAAFAPPSALLVSCAAGVPLAALEASAREHAVARAMPNVGAKYAVSTTACALGPKCDPARDAPRLEAVFGAIGEVRIAPKEEEILAATAIAGSGPAFFLLALEAMEQAGVELGIPRAVARTYASGAMQAAAALAQNEEEVAFGDLRARITSPGGTTIAGLVALEEAGTKDAWIGAVKAAETRAREMAKE